MKNKHIESIKKKLSGNAIEQETKNWTDPVEEHLPKNSEFIWEVWLEDSTGGDSSCTVRADSRKEAIQIALDLSEEDLNGKITSKEATRIIDDEYLLEIFKEDLEDGDQQLQDLLDGTSDGFQTGSGHSVFLGPGR